MNRSTPGLPVHHHLLELTQTHIHRVHDAIQPSHPRSSPSPPAPNPSQHQSLFQWVNSSHEVAKVLEFQLQHHSFQRNPRADLLQNGLVGSPCNARDSQESSPTPQFKRINSSAFGFLHSPTLTSIHDHRRQLFLKEKSFYATRETKTKQTGFSDLVSKLQCPPPGLSCTRISRPSHSHDSARGFTLILCLLHPCQLPHKNIPKSSPTPRLRMPTN